MENKKTSITPAAIKKVILLLQWAAFLFCALGFVALLTSMNIGCLFFLVGAVVFCPIRKFRDIINKLIPKKPLRIAAGIAAGIVSLMVYPEAEPEERSEIGTNELESAYTVLAETSAPETKAPETKAPETKAPETKAPETKAPETKAPETKAPETKAPEIKITNKDSSLSPEIVEALRDVAAFWAPTGTKIHLDPFCSAFQEVKYAGTVEQANTVKRGGWCKSCSEHAGKGSITNPHATAEVIATCYSYEDYINQIPATAFD